MSIHRYAQDGITFEVETDRKSDRHPSLFATIIGVDGKQPVEIYAGFVEVDMEDNKFAQDT